MGVVVEGEGVEVSMAVAVSVPTGKGEVEVAILEEILPGSKQTNLLKKREIRLQLQIKRKPLMLRSGKERRISRINRISNGEVKLKEKKLNLLKVTVLHKLVNQKFLVRFVDSSTTSPKIVVDCSMKFVG